MPKIEELEELVNKFEDRVKLGGLINEKRFAELELKIGELSQKLNEVTIDFPKLKERATEIEDLLDIVNLGLVDYKDNFDKIDSSFSEFKKIPETLESVRANLESKMRELNNSVTNLTANVDVLKNIKEDIIKSTEESITSKVKGLEEGIGQNKVEIEHVKRDLDGFSVALRSFERTVELTNLDDIIRRFDSLDRKIINTETELEKLRVIAPNVSMTTVDVDILKKKIKEMSSTVMDTLNKMNEFEININKKINFLEDLTKKTESANEDVKAQVSKLEETKVTIEKIYNDVNEKVSSLTTFNEEMNKLKAGIEELKTMKSVSDETITEIRNKISNIEGERASSLTTMNEEISKVKTDTENIRGDIGKVYNYVNDRVSSSANIKEEVSKLKNDFEELNTMKSGLDERVANIKNEIVTEVKSQLPADHGMRISNLENQVKNIPSLDFDKNLANIRERINELEKKSFGKTDGSGYDVLRERIEDLERYFIDINKSLSSHQIDIKPRRLRVEDVTKEVPKNIVDEITSLKDIVSRVSSDNSDLKRITRDLRINQMETITSDIFVGVTARISTIEKKLSEIEEEISKMRPNQ